jgi:hypothetical protein
MRVLGDVVAWLLAFLMALVAIAMLRESFLIALFVVVGMLLVLPPSGRFIAGKTGFDGRFKQILAGLGLGLFIGPMSVIMVGGSSPASAPDAATKPQSEAEKAQAYAAAKAEELKLEQEQAAATAKRLAEEKTDVELYAQRLDQEILLIPEIDALRYAKGLDSIKAGLAIIDSWSALYEKGGWLNIDNETQKKRQKFRSLLAKKQAQMFPAMRDAYGPAMRNQLWEADGSAKTFGAGFRTIEFISAAFARNANIKKVNDQMLDTLMTLRFSRVQYKWFDGAAEFTYYTLKPPKDTDIVKWRANGSFHLLDN